MIMRNFILFALLLPLAYSVSTESTNLVSNDKSVAASVSDGAKLKTDEVPTPAPKSSGPPDVKDAYRTRISQIDTLLGKLNPSLSYGNILAPSIAAPALPVPAPLIAAPSQFVWPSYSKWQFAQPYGYDSSSWGSSWVTPPSAYYQSVPAVSHSAPLFPAISQPASIISSGHIVQSVPVVSAQLHSLPVAQPAAVSQTTVAKPVISMSEHVVQQPVYAISQQIIHKPVYTEVIKKIRRPVLTEIEQIIHKPVVTHLQQVIKRPLYAEHIIKPPSYNQISQMMYQAPLHIQGESVHVAHPPTSQSIKLPTQVVQPVATHLVQTPVAHQELATTTSYHIPSKPVLAGVVYGGYPYPSYGYGSYSSGYGLGTYYGSGYGSSYGYLPYAYNPGYGSGYGGLSSASYGEKYQSYLVPSTCRATDTCGRNSFDFTLEGYDFMDVEISKGVTSIRFVPLEEPVDPSTILDTDLDTLLKNSKFKTRYFQLVKEASTEDNVSDDNLITLLKNQKFKTNFIKLIRETFFKDKGSTAGQEKKLFDVAESLEDVKKLAEEDPDKWSNIFKTKIKPNIESMEYVTQS